jgi:tRNA(Ile)-lysidine synthase
VSRGRFGSRGVTPVVPFRSSLVPRLLERCSFPPPGTPIDCAVSGGPDSLALLILAVAAGCVPTAYHVDHGLREGSAGEADLVAQAACALGVASVSLSAPCEPGPNLEARARAARYAVLPSPVATGHTADDQAETVLLNLLRGAGLDGLAPLNDAERHPIIALRRSETRALVEAVGLRSVDDPSNRSLELRRNRVRHELLPLCDDIAARDVVAVIAGQVPVLAEDAQLLEELSLELDPTDAKSIVAAPRPLARRALRRWLRTLLPGGQPPDRATLARVVAVAAGAARACELPGGTRIVRSRGRLRVVGPIAGGRRAPPG